MSKSKKVKAQDVVT